MGSLRTKGGASPASGSYIPAAMLNIPDETHIGLHARNVRRVWSAFTNCFVNFLRSKLGSTDNLRTVKSMRSVRILDLTFHYSLGKRTLGSGSSVYPPPLLIVLSVA